MTSISFPEILAALMSRRTLDGEQMELAVREMMQGRWGETEAAAFLVALRMKGETVQEVAAAAKTLREHMLRFDAGRTDVLDTCGTGGDGNRTFNISTAAALVVAGAGTPVVKHGNRAMSSNSGSADVLAALGVAVEGDATWSKQCFDRANLAFCFAPHFHPALRHVGGVRRKLGVRTVFNMLGPLANPAGAEYQLLGVGSVELLDVLAGALAQLGTRHAFLVCGKDGLDEVSLSAPTMVREIRGNQITKIEWIASDFGLQPCDLSELRVDGPQASAVLIRDVLSGKDGPASSVVRANAAAALMAAERVSSLLDGVSLATESIKSGKAMHVLDALIACKMPAESSGPIPR